MALLATFALFAAASAAAGAEDRKPPLLERYAGTSGSGAPLSEAVRVGTVLYLSGQLGFQPGTRTLVAGGIEPETRQTLENIKRVLQAHGSSMDRVAKCTVFLADMAEWPKMNDVYVTFFRGALPARSALGASGLALNARVEIECIGVVDRP